VTELVQAWFDGWNAHDGARLAPLFAEGGTYDGPTTRMSLHPWDLAPVIEALAAQFSDFAFEPGPAIGGGGTVAVEWLMRGTNDGPVKTGVAPTGRALHVRGTDVLEIRDGKIAAARRTYDRRAMMEQLGLQVIVEPFRQGQASYGYSLHASSGNRAVPGIVALTWIRGRDESERDRVRGHSGKIVGDFLAEPGFIGIVAGFAGERGFTCSAWEDEAALHRALDKQHARAKQDFRTSGLSPGVWTSVWKPHHVNRLWVRCPTCDQPNDATDDPAACGNCGGDLPRRPSYW
jgi:steroid delta-isomerase-like uncharacterized protein